VAPATDKDGQCVLRVLSYDYDTVAQSELDERAHVITQELRARGLGANDEGCEEGEPDPVTLDFDRIRQAAPATAQARPAEPAR
jgi:hypothetical protein